MSKEGLLQKTKNLSYKERLVEIGLPTLEYRRERTDVIQVYKLLNKIDVTSYDLLKVREATVTRGHNLKLFKPRSRTSVRKNAFSHRVIDNWNSLTTEVVQAPTLNAFKSRLNNHWVGPNKFHAKCYEPN